MFALYCHPNRQGITDRVRITSCTICGKVPILFFPMHKITHLDCFIAFLVLGVRPFQANLVLTASMPNRRIILEFCTLLEPFSKVDLKDSQTINRR